MTLDGDVTEAGAVASLSTFMPRGAGEAVREIQDGHEQVLAKVFGRELKTGDAELIVDAWMQSVQAVLANSGFGFEVFRMLTEIALANAMVDAVLSTDISAGCLGQPDSVLEGFWDQMNQIEDESKASVQKTPLTQSESAIATLFVAAGLQIPWWFTREVKQKRK